MYVINGSTQSAITMIEGNTYRFDQSDSSNSGHPLLMGREDGGTLALFLFDGYARSSKRGGAWMNAYVSQSKLKDNLPIVANHQNVVNILY